MFPFQPARWEAALERTRARAAGMAGSRCSELKGGRARLRSQAPQRNSWKGIRGAGGAGRTLEFDFIAPLEALKATQTTNWKPLLAFSIPYKLDLAAWGYLLTSLVAFEFIGIAILLYWIKLRRLIEFAHVLTLLQLLLVFLGLLTVVLLPKMKALVLNYGGGSGSLSNWTLSQTVNVNF